VVLQVKAPGVDIDSGEVKEAILLVQESTTVIDEERKWCCVCGRRKTYHEGW
jgi:hypothetical protein